VTVALVAHGVSQDPSPPLIIDSYHATQANANH
jgi:hypothetical protein